MRFRRHARRESDSISPAAAPNTTIDPSKLLFSLPTICDEIPLTGSTLAPAGQSTFRLHEDDWRQAELVAVTHRQVIEKNLADIRRVLNSRVGIGFPTIVVRSEPRYPLLSVVLTRSDLAEAFGRHTASFRAVGYEAEGNAIDGGFRFRG